MSGGSLSTKRKLKRSMDNRISLFRVVVMMPALTSRRAPMSIFLYWSSGGYKDF